MKRIILIVTLLFTVYSLQGSKGYALYDKNQIKEDEQILQGKVLTMDKEKVIIESDYGEPKELEFVPGEVIIKLKESESKELLLEKPYLQRESEHKVIFSKLKEKYNLGNERPVFKALHETLKKSNLSFMQHTQRIRNKYPKRTKRAPKEIKEVDLFPIYVVEVEEGKELEIIEKLKQDPQIEYIHLNYLYKVEMYPNDPYYSSSGSWGQDYDDLWGLKKIQCEEAWDISQGEGIIVAIVDTGIDYNHEDIAENIWINTQEVLDNGEDDDNNGYIDDIKGWDFIGTTLNESREDNDPMDGLGHGTHVAGTIAAVGNNSKGIIGVAPQVKVMPLKGLDDGGHGDINSLVNCLKYAADNGADVINNSWGGFGISLEIEEVINYAYNAGCIVVAAAGNYDVDVEYFMPANIENVIAVASTDHNDQKSDFSNYGNKIDVAAPGGESEFFKDDGTCDISKASILSLRASNTDMFEGYPSYTEGDAFYPVPGDPNSKYYRALGTSMSCPHVAGSVALLLAEYPETSNEEIRLRIKATSDPFPENYATTPIGAGRINVYTALVSSERPFFEIKDFSLEEELGDGDKIPESGEEIKLIIQIKNIWLDATSVTATLTTNSEYISSILVASSDFGSIAQGETRDNASNPFIFQIGIIEFEKIVNFRLIINYDGFTQSLDLKIPLGVRKIAEAVSFVTDLDISDNKIVWFDDYKGNGTIYLYDLEIDQKSMITNVHSKEPLSGLSIYANKIVWLDYRDNAGSVYLYDLETSQEKLIVPNSKYPQRPFIFDNKIVWDGSVGSNVRDIYLYDLETSQEKQITTDPSVDVYPSIFGNKIIWERYSWREEYDMYGYDLYLYDLETNQETLIIRHPLTTPPILPADLSIYSNKILWNDHRYYVGGIHIYDLEASKEILHISNDDPNDWYKLYPDIYENKIVWQDERYANKTICLYDLDTNQEKRITTSDYDCLYPAISDNKIVWTEDEKRIYITEIPVLPSSPSDLVAIAVSSTQIDLDWVDNSNNEHGFKIERKTAGEEEFTEVADIDVNTISYSDTGLNPSTTYYYRAYTYNGVGISEYSNEVSATTLPDTVLPQLEIINPKNGEVVSGQVKIEAEATDNIGIRNVEFYIDENLVASDFSAPYEYTWDTGTRLSLPSEVPFEGLKLTPTRPAGSITPLHPLDFYENHTIKAVAFDTSGNQASDEIAVKVRRKILKPDIEK